jgi:hypothetical protein
MGSSSGSLPPTTVKVMLDADNPGLPLPHLYHMEAGLFTTPVNRRQFA